MCPNRLWFMKTKLKPGILWHPQKSQERLELTFSHEEQKKRTNIDGALCAVRFIFQVLQGWKSLWKGHFYQ